jgi:NTE family protein
MAEAKPSIGVVLTGGGARAAYQVGLLRYLARSRPDFRFDVLTGVSAGAINAAHFARHEGTTLEAAEELAQLWCDLTPDRVFRVDSIALLRGLARWLLRLVSGGSRLAPKVRGLVDTAPLDAILRRVLHCDADGRIAGIARNLQAERLRALALSTVDYGSGRTITWVEGRDVRMWQRANREGRLTRVKVEHVMASAALPLLFPAVRIGSSWHGDGGIRLSAPLSPALHLGADRIVAISTRYAARDQEREASMITGYPPPAQVAGLLMNAIFLDLLDQDARRLELVNQLLRKLPPEEWKGLRPVELMVLRPSQNLGRLAGELEARLPRAFRFLTRGLGTRETRSPDILSMLMFQPDYVRRLIDLGEADASAHEERISRLLN